MSDEAVTGAANYCEFISPVKPTGKVLLARAGMVFKVTANIATSSAAVKTRIPARARSTFPVGFTGEMNSQ